MHGGAHLGCDSFDLLQIFYDEESCLELLSDSHLFVTKRLNTIGTSEMSEVKHPGFRFP